jgi:uncharacterized heparinase superfamily protein
LKTFLCTGADLHRTRKRPRSFAVRSTLLEEREVYERERTLQMLRGRIASSFALMSDEEYRARLDRAERELPDKLESAIEIAMLSARR